MLDQRTRSGNWRDGTFEPECLVYLRSSVCPLCQSKIRLFSVWGNKPITSEHWVKWKQHCPIECIYFDRIGGNKGVSVGLGCRRGGSHSKATVVVYISVLISPKHRQSVCQVIVNLTQLSVNVSLDSFRSSWWQDSGMTECAENLN